MDPAERDKLELYHAFGVALNPEGADFLHARSLDRAQACAPLCGACRTVDLIAKIFYQEVVSERLCQIET